MTTKLFWIIASLEFVAVVVFLVLILAGTLRTGPEGPVGAFVLLIPLMVVGVMGAVVFFSKSETAAKVCLALLALQAVPFVVVPIYTAGRKRNSARMVSGDAFFTGAKRELAHAIKAGDLAKVKELIPAAGNLNESSGDETLLWFALDNARTGGARIEIVQALLAARADPNRRVGDQLPLEISFYAGSELTEIMLKAGASPNSVDSAGQPAWWGALRIDGTKILEHCLAHGADLSLKDDESGPVGYAVAGKKWAAALMLIERGASWKNDARYGQSVDERVNFAMQNDAPAELRTLSAKIASAR